MKIKTTRKYIRAVYDTILSVNYCGAQFLLWNDSPIYYNSGVYGWNCDYHIINGVCICTGYRPHGISTKETIEITNKYDKMAKAIIDDYNLPYEKRVGYVGALRGMWIDELINYLKSL